MGQRPTIVLPPKGWRPPALTASVECLPGATGLRLPPVEDWRVCERCRVQFVRPYGRGKQWSGQHYCSPDCYHAAVTEGAIGRILDLAVPEPNSGCLIWLGGLDRSGYGKTSIGGRHFRAHTALYTLAIGPVPDGKVLRHSCDVRCCIEPTHLTPGTIAENNADMKARGRTGRKDGENNPQAKLTPAAVDAIRADSASSEKVLAVAHGVSPATISDVRSGRTWRGRQPLALPPKGFRKQIPSGVKVAIVARQEGRCAECGEALAGSQIHYDHRPPLSAREWLPHLEDTLPGANDPAHLEAIHEKPCHAKRTAADATTRAKVNRTRAREADHADYMAEKVPGQHRGRQSKGFR